MTARSTAAHIKRAHSELGLDPLETFVDGTTAAGAAPGWARLEGVWALVFLHNIAAVFIAYTLTRTCKAIVAWVGYEKILRCPSGILGSRCLFMALNLALMWVWVGEIVDEARSKKQERLTRVKEEVAWWNNEVARLERLLGGIRDMEAETQLLSETPARDRHLPKTRHDTATAAADEHQGRDETLSTGMRDARESSDTSVDGASKDEDEHASRSETDEEGSSPSASAVSSGVGASMR